MLFARRDDRLTAGQARLLRDALVRIGAGERGPRLDPLPAGVRGRLRDIERALGAAAIEPGETAGAAQPIHVALVGVDRLGDIKDMGGRAAERITEVLTDRIRAILPGAALRRTGRGVLEFAFPCAPDEAAMRLEALHAALQARIEVAGEVFELPVAIGFARGEPKAGAEAALAEAAEEALVTARDQHLRVAEFDEAAHARRSDRAALMRDLRAALDTDALSLVYQPKLDARTGAITSAEALLRWRHPERGMVPPDLFVGLAERTGDIRRLTERVFRMAVADQARMAGAGVLMGIDINLSGALLCDGGFTAWALEQVAGASGPLNVELTETAGIRDPELAIVNLRAFSDAGVRIALDDFGSGLSTLSYLKRLPAHELKIDKSFILGLTSSTRDPLIVRSTIELAHALEMSVTAEGVETAAARALLTVMGCDRLQGYGISHPLPPDAFIRFIHERAEPEASATPSAPRLTLVGGMRARMDG